MLNFGSITPSSGASSKWKYTGGAPPSTIQTISGVTGIKNPLPANPDFYQIFDSLFLGLDYFEGNWYNGASDFVINGTADIGGSWLAVMTAQDPTSNEGTQIISLKDKTIREATNSAGTIQLIDELTHRGWRVINGISNSTLFRIDNTGHILTNQIINSVSTNTHDYDLPIYDASNVLKGYIKIYRP